MASSAEGSDLGAVAMKASAVTDSAASARILVENFMVIDGSDRLID